MINAQHVYANAKQLFLWSLLLLVVLLTPHSAAATTSQFDALFDAPCARYKVPKVLVLAIAQTESSLKPWMVNVAGKDFRAKSREEALRIIYEARARGLSHDVGLMQVNSWWLKYLGISPETALEPHNNAMLGVWILAQEIQRHGLNWKAVGAYHSPTPRRQASYARSVYKRYLKLQESQ